MFQNFLKIAFRNLVKHRGYSLINILGLSIGISCFILILSFVYHEVTYDRFHEKADRIYRLAVRAMIGDTRIRQTGSSAITFKRLFEDFPEIETGVKFLKFGDVPVILGEKTFYEKIYAVDPTFYDVFSIPMILGDPKTVLKQPNTMVVTRQTAVKYFGDTNVVGKVISLDFSDYMGMLDFVITGVSEDVPVKSHFHYQFLISTETFPRLINNQGWSANRFTSYLVLKPGTSRQLFEDKLKEFTRKNMGGERYDDWVAKGNFWEYYLQPITEIHLNSDLNGEFEPNGNQTYVSIFFLVSIIVLSIACINFMNLSTAKASLRAREVGIRKVAGSDRSKLIFQFIGESILMSFIALMIALIIVATVMPFYQTMVNRQLQIHFFDNFFIIPGLILLGLLVGIIAGSYPAFILSAFKPVRILKGRFEEHKGGLWLRNVLVIFQFAISIFLIIGTITVYQQLNFLQNKKLGFTKEQVMVVSNPGALGKNLSAFKAALCQYSGIEQVSGSSTLPGKSFSNLGFGAEGVEKHFTLNVCVCDENFLNTLQLKLVQGRFFSPEFPSDSTAAILNQKAVEMLGWKDPIGKKVNDWGEERVDFTVIGVIEDYHYESLHQEIRPMGLFRSGGPFGYDEDEISVRFSSKDISEVIKNAKNTWNKFAPGKPFEYSFLDEDYGNLYHNERRTRQLFTVFSFLAIIIASMGLFGLASFSAERRTKEIGIRKALGATPRQIIFLLIREFIKWVLIANLIAWPVAFMMMNNWLQNFSYRINIQIASFVLAAGLAFGIALMTVIYQAIKAAIMNPVNALKYE